MLYKKIMELRLKHQKMLKKITDVNFVQCKRATSLHCRTDKFTGHLSGLPLVTTQTCAGLEDHQPEDLRICRFHTWSLNGPWMSPTSPFEREEWCQHCPLNKKTCCKGSFNAEKWATWTTKIFLKERSWWVRGRSGWGGLEHRAWVLQHVELRLPVTMTGNLMKQHAWSATPGIRAPQVRPVVLQGCHSYQPENDPDVQKHQIEFKKKTQ